MLNTHCHTHKYTEAHSDTSVCGTRGCVGLVITSDSEKIRKCKSAVLNALVYYKPFVNKANKQADQYSRKSLRHNLLGFFSLSLQL